VLEDGFCSPSEYEGSETSASILLILFYSHIYSLYTIGKRGRGGAKHPEFTKINVGCMPETCWHSCAHPSTHSIIISEIRNYASIYILDCDSVVLARTPS
jgi:hypothetical protein